MSLHTVRVVAAAIKRSPYLPFTTAAIRRSNRPAWNWLLAVSLALAASGCDYLGLEPVSQIEARKEAEGRAIGGACRQAGRALEDCFTFNPRMPRASLFAGWRDMNDYMLENKLMEVRPEVAPVLPAGRSRTDPIREGDTKRGGPGV